MNHQEPAPLDQPDEIVPAPLITPCLCQQHLPASIFLRSPDVFPSVFVCEVHSQGSNPLPHTHSQLLARQQDFLSGLFPKKSQDHGPLEGLVGWEQRLGLLLQGDVSSLTTVRPLSFQAIDTALDAHQREAVGLAMATPDFCLIQGGPGSGKSRLAAEIVRQFAARKQRILLLGPGSEAIDAVLEYLLGDPTLWILRSVSHDEEAESLTPALQHLTLSGWKTQYRQAIDNARQNHETCLAHLQQAEATRDALAKRGALTEVLVQDQQRLSLLEQECIQIPDQVASEVAAARSTPKTAFQEGLIALERERTLALTALRTRLESERSVAATLSQQLLHLKRQADILRPRLEALQGKRWWTLSFWLGHSQPGLEVQFAKLGDQSGSCEQQLAQAQQEMGRLESELTNCGDRFDRERERMIQEEVDRRTKTLALRRAECETDVLTSQQELQKLETGSENPSQSDFELVRRKAAEARHWLECLEQSWETIPQTLLNNTNLVAASLSALRTETAFAAGQLQFDLVLVEDAHKLTETELKLLGLQAPRCVLIGQPLFTTEPVGRPDHNPLMQRNTRAAHLKPAIFVRLWQQLHIDPRTLPYSWMHRDGRLSCRLQTFASDQERWIQVETVADRPDVELHILSAPRLPSQLVEVVFPPAMTVHEAKEYLYRELEELTVQSRSSFFRWREHHGRLELCLNPDKNDDVVFIQLEPGVRELVTLNGAEESEPIDGPSPWQTCGLDFDTSQGWDRDRAEAWVAKRLRLRHLGRSVFLARNHRMQPALAAWIDQILLAGSDLRSENSSHRFEPAAHFIAIPSAGSVNQPRHHPGDYRHRSGGTATLTAPQRHAHGAGLEMDLADSKRVDQVPNELRPLLPAMGLINYLEALAVVRTVETILTDPATTAESSRWLEKQHLSERHPFLAILACTPAQVELLSLLLRRLPRWSNWNALIEIGVPTQYQHRQCHTALVSLVRSHTHRAVTFGRGPDDLVLALTRATSRLLVFGDPGTLRRRGQWPGPLDHLDDAEANQERYLVSRLIAEMQRDGKETRLLSVHDGGFF